MKTRIAAMQYEMPTLRRIPEINRQIINQAEAGNIANANCQQKTPICPHSIPASNFVHVRAATSIPLNLQAGTR
ncbi:MAG TPA: hypothetical protein VNW52_07485 [Burkholderiaceae bacterium]|nr:hypothetical protein [Burkholderiaceae bacterium]